MNYRLQFLLVLVLFLASGPAIVAEEEAVDEDRAANLVILNEIAVKNLGLETVEVLETDFEETIFAIGRIRAVPSNHAVVSSRIAGRVIGLKVIEGDVVKEGQELVLVESLQPGDPPPVIPLKAPIAGMVTESHTRLGEPIEPANELLDIVDLSTVWAVARVPEAEVGSLALGSKAHIQIPAIGKEIFDGTLIRFGTTADEVGGTLDAVFEIANPEFRLRPGMRTEFSIVVSSRSDVMAAPREAIQGDPTNRVVFVKDFELPNAFLRSAVHLGQQNERYVEIVSGLFPGDEVVTKGAYSLSFASGASGISLKEALDAAHGHEHAEDGSELTPDNPAAAHDDHAGHDHGDHGGSGSMTLAILIYAGVITALFIGAAQLAWRNRKSAANAN